MGGIQFSCFLKQILKKNGTQQKSQRQEIAGPRNNVSSLGLLKQRPGDGLGQTWAVTGKLQDG